GPPAGPVISRTWDGRLLAPPWRRVAAATSRGRSVGSGPGSPSAMTVTEAPASRRRSILGQTSGLEPTTSASRPWRASSTGKVLIPPSGRRRRGVGGKERLGAERELLVGVADARHEEADERSEERVARADGVGAVGPRDPALDAVEHLLADR